MTIYAIIAHANPDKLASAIATTFKDAHLQLNEKAWLVAGTGTSKEISDRLGVTDGKSGSAVIVEISNYYGRAPNNVWAWIKNKWEATSDG